jgi:hypothetical protein
MSRSGGRFSSVGPAIASAIRRLSPQTGNLPGVPIPPASHCGEVRRLTGPPLARQVDQRDAAAG